ncbi:MAG: hypothetical protein GXY65_06715 [Rhodococcus sp.]|uniref:hypothetical protein n=1 Tax=Rhodococcus TaxID=1827 RepID=UPI0016B6188E|nr:hypothetical protein [Rhodococcus sp. (in: high G+C Gram-positive bacteria)]NLV79029.1 hypothetical protein [Rhodococcus sp. (in: high G+C Gram-positive bacteria)]
MTSVSESRPDSAAADLVHPIDDTSSLGGALRVAGEGAVALAQGSTAAGLFVARKGIDVTKDLAARARRARQEAAQRARDEVVPLLEDAVSASKSKAVSKSAAVSKSKAVTKAKSLSKAAKSEGEKPRRKGRTTLIVAGAIGAVALGGLVFSRSRRSSHPPVAAEPPRVQPRPVAAEDVPAES